MPCRYTKKLKKSQVSEQKTDFGQFLGAVLRTLCWAVCILVTDSCGSRFSFVHGIEVAIKGVLIPSGVGVEIRGSYELLD